MNYKASRTRTLGSLVTGAWLALSGCTPTDPIESIPVEVNDLNISHVEIAHSYQAADRVLTIQGFDDSEQELAQVTLRLGMVLYSPEPELMDPTWSAGTELKLSA